MLYRGREYKIVQGPGPRSGRFSWTKRPSGVVEPNLATMHETWPQLPKPFPCEPLMKLTHKDEAHSQICVSTRPAYDRSAWARWYWENDA
jgi:hypothetical protein